MYICVCLCMLAYKCVRIRVCIFMYVCVGIRVQIYLLMSFSLLA